ncbi:hypothetical protein [Methanospirillum hungatei]|uniref:hypothetical protein n=1 Tax=Methanospirillum hungatei TaxID=2203 RepID=UPI0026F28262|nr:hypothetical protein [Methanospirillum hungatei]MCA1915724.1 hypothetical protein [Methanospirillum hungatei]
MHLDELRTILLEERDTGELTMISPDLFMKTSEHIRSLQQEVYSHEDPFSDEARLLIEKVSSVRATVEELFKIRTDKIVGLALSQAEGSYIEREELRSLIPAELEMFNRIVDAIRQSKTQLIEWKATPARQVRVGSDEENLCVEGSEPAVLEDINRAEESDYNEPVIKTSSDAPFANDIVLALSSMEPFMGIDGRTYEMDAGDILTLPSRNAQVLVERDIVLNIHPG